MSTPEPLVSPETDLQSFDYMPLKVAQLRDSDLAAIATDGEFRAAVILWCAAWHQVPASSLPNDDRMLCRLAGLGRDLKTWGKVRSVALRGFVMCSDGRLYHPLIADLAIVAWQKKKRNVERTHNATEARRQRNGQREGNVTSTKGEGDRKGEEMEREEGTPLPPKPGESFNFDAVKTSWNLLAEETGLAKVQALTEPRKSAIRRRFADIGGLEGWYVLLDKIRGSPYLRGGNDRGWRVVFDWVLKPENLTKIMEGNYDARTNSAHRAGSIDESWDQFDAVVDEAKRRENRGNEAAGEADAGSLPRLREGAG